MVCNGSGHTNPINHMKIKIDNAYAGEHETVIGFDSEYADYGNPAGAVYGIQASVIAETPDGRRFVHNTAFESLAAAEGLAVRVFAAKVINLDHWVETYEIYGSPAWQEADDARAYAHACGPLAGFVRDI